MRIQFDIGHPAHVHLWKNTIKFFQRRGHETFVTCRNKDVALRLLKAFQIDYYPVGNIGNTKIQLLGEWIQRDIKIINIAKNFKPDIFVGALNPCIAHASALMDKPCIVFNDSEIERSTGIITYPFTDAIITPEKYSKCEGRKQIRIKSYKELAYLHPNNFKPTGEIFNYMNTSKSDDYVILRFVSWGAGHDVGKMGFSNQDIIKLVSKLEKEVKVYISSERKLPNILDKNRVSFPPELMHEALYHAKLVIGDSQTMITESGVLGTPAVRCNDFVGKSDMSNFVELEKQYKLIYNFNDAQCATEKVFEILNQNNIKSIWKQKRHILLNEKIDLSKFFQWFIENYPENENILRNEPDYQNKFIIN